MTDEPRATPPKLGQIIKTPQERDAIHIAVVAVLATERLAPGEHVGLIKSAGVEHTAGRSSSPIGVVDPFLPGPIFQGDRFWLFLYPNTITTLRHAWTHPAFEAGENLPSEAWLRNFAASTEIGLAYDEMMRAAVDHLDKDEYLTQGDRWEGVDVPAEFWDHFEAATGRKVPADKRWSFFSCSC